jgi:hypothetical protein
MFIAGSNPFWHVRVIMPFKDGLDRPPKKDRVMFFLIRTAFWFSLVLLALPLGGTDENGRSVGPVEALAAAREAVSDVAGICERKPDVCVTGLAALQTIGVRAREGARIAYEALDEQYGEQDSTATGSVPNKMHDAAAR